MFSIYKEFASYEQIENMKERYLNGISWKEVKEGLYELLDSSLNKPRSRYFELINDTKKIDDILKEGANKVRESASNTLNRVRLAIGK